MICKNCGCEPLPGESHCVEGTRTEFTVDLHCYVRKDNPSLPFHRIDALQTKEQHERIH